MPGLTDVATNPGVGTTTNTWTYDTTAPTVTINQGAGQADPAFTTPIVFDVVFTESVSDFTASDVTLTGTAPGTLAKTVTGSGANYEVSVTGMTGAGTVIADIAAGVATDAAGNANAASTSTDNTVLYDPSSPTAAITYSPTGPVKTGVSNLRITATFSEAMADSPAPKIAISGANILAATAMTRTDATHYTYAHTVGAGTGPATVALSIGTDVAGNVITAAPTSGATFTVDNTAPAVTITKKAGQADPTNTAPILFTVVFSESVADFATGDVTLSGTAGATTAAVTGTGMNYEVSVTGMTASGTVIASIAAGTAHDAAGNPNTVSTSTDNTVAYDVTAPTAAITYSPASPVKEGASLTITVTFSEAMADSPAPKIAISGANTVVATAMTKTDATHYTYTYMVGAGNGTATVALSVGTDLAGNPITPTPTSGATFTVEKKETKPTPGFGLTEIVAAGAVALVAIAAVKNKGKKPKK